MSNEIETCVLCGSRIENDDIKGYVINKCTYCPNTYHAHHQCGDKVNQHTFVDKVKKLSSYMKPSQTDKGFVAAINKNNFLVMSKCCVHAHIQKKGKCAKDAINNESMFIVEILHKSQQVPGKVSVPKATAQRKEEKVSLVPAFLNNESKKTNYRFF